MLETIALIGFGFGIGWIASYFFVHDRLPSKPKLVPDVIERNET